jgi:protein SCO1/2
MNTIMALSSATSPNTDPGGPRRRRPLLWGTLGAVLAVALMAVVLRFDVGPSAADLPVLGTVPAFTLTAGDGRPMSADDLRGQVWIADFIFTRCPSQCPMLTANMAKVQKALPADPAGVVRLVSFSVDPAYDTPEVLRAYAERFGADTTRWAFLTGDRQALYTLIREGFHLAVGEEAGSEGMITHSDRFILVDRDLRIRGYYSGSDTEAQARLVRDAAALRASS